MLTDTANAALSQTSTSRKAKRNARQQAKAQRELEKDQEARPYAYQQQAVRNAYTLGAPADDRGARARAMSAQAIYNDLERNNASPEELAAAQQEYKQWANWASMSRANRDNILQRGRKQAEMGAAKNQFSGIMNERQTPGAAELLRREALAMAGGPQIGQETIKDGRVTSREVAGRYGSGSVVDTGKRGGGDPALRALTEGLLLDQAARGTAPPSYDSQLAKYQRPEARAAQLAASLAPGTGAGPRDGSYAAQVLADYQSRITPQGQAPTQQVAMAPVVQQQNPMLMDTIKSPAASVLMQPAAVVPVAPAPTVASSQPAPVAPVAGSPAPQQPMGTSGRDARAQLGELSKLAFPLVGALSGTVNAIKGLPEMASDLVDQGQRDKALMAAGAFNPIVNAAQFAWKGARKALKGR